MGLEVVKDVEEKPAKKRKEPKPGIEVEGEKSDLVDLVEKVSRVVSPRSSHPVLGGIRLRVADGLLEASATNLELAVDATTAAGLSTDGVTVVPGRLFGSILKALPPGRVVIRADASEIRVSSGRSTFSLSSLLVEDFPEFAAITEEFAVDLDAAEFGRALRAVVPAVSPDEVRPVLTGVYFHLLGDAETHGLASTLTLAATDSYRLALRTMTVKATHDFSEGRSAIIPGASLVELQKHLAGVEGPVRISLGEAQAEVRLKGVRLRTRLIEGEYPKFQQLVPAPGTNNRILTVGRTELFEVAARVSLVAGTNTPVKIALGEEIRLTAVEAGVGEGDEVLDGAVYEGEPMTVAFNPRFLGDALDHTEGDRVRIELANPTKPSRIVGEGHDELAWVVMPVRLSR